MFNFLKFSIMKKLIILIIVLFGVLINVKPQHEKYKIDPSEHNVSGYFDIVDKYIDKHGFDNFKGLMSYMEENPDAWSQKFVNFYEDVIFKSDKYETPDDKEGFYERMNIITNEDYLRPSGLGVVGHDSLSLLREILRYNFFIDDGYLYGFFKFRGYTNIREIHPFYRETNLTEDDVGPISNSDRMFGKYRLSLTILIKRTEDGWYRVDIPKNYGLNANISGSYGQFYSENSPEHVYFNDSIRRIRRVVLSRNAYENNRYIRFEEGLHMMTFGVRTDYFFNMETGGDQTMRTMMYVLINRRDDGLYDLIYLEPHHEHGKGALGRGGRIYINFKNITKTDLGDGRYKVKFVKGRCTDGSVRNCDGNNHFIEFIVSHGNMEVSSTTFDNLRMIMD